MLLLISLGRIFFIQCFRSRYLRLLAQRQQNLFIYLEPQRGAILDCNLKPQAINLPSESLYAVPGQIKDKSSTVQRLLPILGVKQSYLEERLNSNKQFIW
jgi:stage V sporulation protein D (sporulation-specific penicillin-binding protein)